MYLFLNAVNSDQHDEISACRVGFLLEMCGGCFQEILMLLENDVTPVQVCSLIEMCQENKEFNCEADLVTLCQNPEHAKVSTAVTTYKLR